MSKIYVIGIDSSGLHSEHRQLLQQCRCIVSSNRLAPYAKDIQAEIIPVTPLEEAFAKIARTLEVGDVAVLASGDPLFFGIGSNIIEHFGSDRVRIFPAISSLQEAFAKFKLPWTDATIISLHGRQAINIPATLLCNRKTFLFTDRTHSPDSIAKMILEYLDLIGEERIKAGCMVHVAEDLGSETERITTGSLEAISQMSFSALNVVCLALPEALTRPTFGLQEDEISHSRGLITKDEVRAATLHALRLPRKGVFWDIGGGSGSISLEAASLFPELAIYTVERNADELANIKENIRRFSLFNITPVSGRAAGLLAELPSPDSVFVGGSGGELEHIITASVARLAQGGRLVVNGVTEKTVSRAPQLMEAHGLTVTTSRIEVSRTGPNGPQRFNPITIMVGRK